MSRAWIMLVALLPVAAWVVLGWPQPLDVDLNVPVREYRTRAGAHAVTLRLVRASASGDNGPVNIVVLVNQRPAGTLLSSFSYDTLRDQPAGAYRLAWLDGDLWPDVQLETHGEQAFYVGSRDGRLYAYTKH